MPVHLVAQITSVITNYGSLEDQSEVISIDAPAAFQLLDLLLTALENHKQTGGHIDNSWLYEFVKLVREWIEFS